MKRIITFLSFLLAMMAWPVLAQDIDESFVFVDEDGEIIENGATVVRNVVEIYDEETGSEVINSGVSVMKLSGSANDYLKMHYSITQIDNGSYQICFPTTCNMKSAVGVYETTVGQLMGDLQDIQSEWFPVADGECVVTLTIEIFTKEGLFPPQYTHKADGPSVSIRFIKSSGAPGEGGAYIQLAEDVYLDGTTLYIGSGVTSLGDLQVNPSEIYCYATIPPACMANTFANYDATLHVPAAGMVSYFTTPYWYNFNNILSDAIEPLSVTMNAADAELEIGQQLSLSAIVAPGDATPNTVYWSSSDASVASVSAGGTVTAVATGECDILAICVDKVAVCHVTIVPPRVTITLDKHEARLLPNHTITLTATCSPIDVDLAVTSSNPGVAIPRLVNGTIMVVGVAEGTATITVNAADGWSNPDSCEVTVFTEHGDVNSDGYVNISDVTALIDYLLSGNPSGVNLTRADCNNDGGINISDVTTLIDYLLSGRWPWEYGYVDLGLPSGTLWATCNIGASRLEEYGDYFAQGETEPKEIYDWSTYKWCNRNYNKLTKYCNNSAYGYNGFVDNKEVLEPEDDAAYVNWGSSWCMPTHNQLGELKIQCTWTWTTRNGVNGYLVTGPNGNTLFFPTTGYRYGDQLGEAGLYGICLSRQLYYSSAPYDAIVMFVDSGDGSWYPHGLTVRAVRVAQNQYPHNTLSSAKYDN